MTAFGFYIPPATGTYEGSWNDWDGKASTDIVLYVRILRALQRGSPDGFIQQGRQYPQMVILRGTMIDMII